MKRFLLYPLVSVVMLAGEPAVGGPVEPAPAPRQSSSTSLLAPIIRILSAIASPHEPTASSATPTSPSAAD